MPEAENNNTMAHLFRRFAERVNSIPGRDEGEDGDERILKITARSSSTGIVGPEVRYYKKIDGEWHYTVMIKEI